MVMNSCDIRDVKLLTYAQICEVFEEVAADIDTRFPPDYHPDELLTLNEVSEQVKATLEKVLRQILMGAHQQLFTPPWAQKDEKR